MLNWHQKKNTRQMPWKGEKDPYRIWLSEIILQQTRVEQGTAYYHRFLEAFPTIRHLASATDEKVFKLWEGLGYYSRCRNLLATARYITQSLGGRFPDTYESIRALKGVGPYTAAAIASFAYGLPHAVVDGNVFRVLSRIYGIRIPIDSTAGKKYFSELAETLLDQKKPGLFNQAIMDFGAVVCKPAAPLCTQCTFSKHCIAFLGNKVSQFPVKEKKNQVRKRWFYYLVLNHHDQTAVRERTARDIWRGLYEFALVEAEKELTTLALLKQAEKEQLIEKGKYRVRSTSAPYRQLLTHQQVNGRFITLQVSKKSLPGLATFRWLTPDEIRHLAFPRLVNQYFSGR